jgi:hypothetical protein
MILNGTAWPHGRSRIRGVPDIPVAFRNRKAFGLCTHPGGLIFVTRFQISAFLRAHPVVTILAPVTNRNQAT